MSNDRTPCDDCACETLLIALFRCSDGVRRCNSCCNERMYRREAGESFAEGIAFVFATRDASEGWQRVSEPSPAWVWKTVNDEFMTGTLDDGLVLAAATVLSDRALVTIHAETNVLELRTALPAWSQAQQRRWVEQWVASQADAAVAAFEAAEGMR